MPEQETHRCRGDSASRPKGKSERYALKPTNVLWATLSPKHLTLDTRPILSIFNGIKTGDIRVRETSVYWIFPMIPPEG